MDRAAEFRNLRVLTHPLIQERLTAARDQRTTSAQFRHLLNQIAGLMTFEACRDFPTRTRQVRTPLERTRGIVLCEPITLVPILRAGLAMTDGILALIPDARVGHMGIYRDETSLEPVAYYAKFPLDVACGPVLLIDPMLATGGSAAHAVSVLKDKGCRDIRFMCLVCAPEGVRCMAERHPDVLIHAASLDREIDERGFIRPGLGDAGDRIFGTT